MTIDVKMEAGFRPASRISSIGVSEILQIGARAAAMKRKASRSSSLAPANLISKRPTMSSRQPGTPCSVGTPNTPRSTARRR